MKRDEMAGLLKQLKDIRIAVVGDYFLDKYLLIDPEKDEPSLETGLTAYQVVGKRMSPGAAGTVTNNLVALGIGSIIAVGIIGDDGEGLELTRALQANGVNTDYLIKTKERVTPTYTKPMRLMQDGEQELNRLDIKNFSPTPSTLVDRIASSLRELAGQVDGIIALDQVVEADYGVITAAIREVLAELGQQEKCPVIYTDSRAYTSLFRNIIVKCNHHEVVKAIRPEFTGEADEKMVVDCGIALSKKTGRSVFVTWGTKGQLVIDGESVKKVSALKVEGPVDICGAGDAATSGIVSALCCGTSKEDAALLGNIVASITIQQLGTTGTASPEQVLERFIERDLDR